MKLRPYQEDAVHSVLDGWAAGESAVVVAPTGAGKTVIMADLVKNILDGGGRVLVLAHRNELILQAKRTFEGFGFSVGVERGTSKASPLDMVVISSMQTMAGKRRSKFSSGSFTHILIDEAHHILAKSYQETIEFFSGAKLAGVTATPAEGTVKFFGREFTIDRAALESEGFLARPLIQKISLAVDMRGAKMSVDKSRIADGEAGQRIDPHLRKFVKLLPQLIGDAPGVVFLPLVATSKLFRDIAEDAGIKVEHVDGGTSQPDRTAAYKRIRSGESQILANANLLTEGFDLPALRWVCLLRPVMSPVFYEQAVGRAARIAPGKKTFLVLDPMFLSDQHVLGGLDLFGIDENLAAEMEIGDGVYNAEDIAALAELSKPELLAKQEESRLERERKIALDLQYRGGIARKVGSLKLASEPQDGDDQRRPSTKQKAMLNKMRIKWAGDQLGWAEITTTAQATRVLGACIQRSRAGLASPAVVAGLARYLRVALQEGRIERVEAVAKWSNVATMTQADVNEWVRDLKEK